MRGVQFRYRVVGPKGVMAATKDLFWAKLLALQISQHDQVFISVIDAHSDENPVAEFLPGVHPPREAAGKANQ